MTDLSFAHNTVRRLREGAIAPQEALHHFVDIADVPGLADLARDIQEIGGDLRAVGLFLDDLTAGAADPRARAWQAAW